jgi:hypothetical protein
MELTSVILIIVGVVWAGFLVLPFMLTLAGLFRNDPVGEKTEVRDYDYACVITAYRNAAITEGLIESLLNQTYKHFHIYLVADACDLSGWNLSDERLTVLRPEPALNLKIKSVIHAMDHFVRPHDFTVVFDADNLAHPDFLSVINDFACRGWKSIQGQRTAKNLDTVYACADAIGEFYKNWIDRYMPWRLGSSAVISGSGMAVETGLYRAYLASKEISEGQHQYKRMLQEDKILQNFLLRQNERIAYAWDAIVYDEKVSSGDAVETQRSRWLFSYFQNTGNALGILRRGLVNLSFNQLLFGLITIAPPMFIQVGVGVLLAGLALFTVPWVSLLLLLSLLVFGLNIFLVLHLSKVPPQIWRAIWHLPAFVFRQMKALLKMSNPDKNFKPTEHNKKVKIDELLKQPGAESQS